MIISMKNFILILLILLFSRLVINAQDVNMSIMSEDNLRRIKESGYGWATNMDALYEGLRGTPYLINEWLAGNVYFADNSVIEDVPLKLDVYTDRLMYQNPTSLDSFVIDKSIVKMFILNNEVEGNEYKFEKVNIEKKDGEEGMFLHLLYDGNIRLYKQYSKHFIPADYKGAYSAGRKYDELKDDEQLMIYKEGELHKISTGKRSLLKVLSGKKDEMKNYIKAENLSMSGIKDIISVLGYYESID